MTFIFEADCDVSYRARSSKSDSFYRMRTPKTIRTVRHKKSSAPGSTRQRRNKHWAW